MIEKLDRHIKTEENGVRISCPPTQADCIDKINEVIDVVNELQLIKDVISKPIDILKDTIGDMQNTNENVQDKFVEQRKWIGKLCRCWDSDINDDIWGILQDIKDNKTEKYYLYGIGYEHCEPVKPEDNIIYKGGDNE